MDDKLIGFIASLPNLAIAIWCIRQYQDTIKTLLENQQKLISQLMKLHPPQTKEGAAEIVKDAKEGK